MNYMTAKAFVDTNILVYAYDQGAGIRHEKALALVKQLWLEGNGTLSTQVLQEFYVNVRRKAQRPITAEQARALISDYLAWDPIVNDGAAMLEAIDVEKRYQLSFWDSLIVAAARKGGASIIYSEDFNHGQRFGSVEVKNPFRNG
jgi:predicted nucleic acid-binding protein